MSADDDLERFRSQMRDRTSKKRPTRKQKVWEAPEHDDLAYGKVLAFDQSLANTGVVILDNDPNLGLRVRLSATLRPQSTATSFEGTYARSLQIYDQVRQVVFFAPHDVTEIVMEMPSVSGHRTESSLLAGAMVQLVSRDLAQHVPVKMVSNRTMRSILLEPSKANGGKSEVRDAVERLIPDEARDEYPGRSWNEHTRDAAALAVAWLYTKKKRAAA